MKKKRVLALFCLLFLIFALPIKAEAEGDKSKHIILIDPGHGGIDGGAKSKNGTIEKDINLSIATKLKNKLEDCGYEVYMTREDDTQLEKKKVSDLNARCKMKKDTNCEVFISIHQNMFPQSNCFGAQIWYSSNEKSKILAENVQETLKQKIDDNNKRIPKEAKDQYRILSDGYDGACIIAECGFLSNPNEEERLKSDDHQNKIVDGITLGINNYFETINK